MSETVEYETIKVGVEGSLGRIHLNRPDARNPLNKQSAAEILAALKQHFADPAVCSLVISAEGDAYCAGGDLRQMKAFGSMPPTEAYAWPEDIVRAHKLMLNAPKPVIAAVDGPAAAGGMGLAGMCDILVATRRAKFSMPEVRVGLFPMIIVAHLSRALPRKILMEMMFTGDSLSAEDAKALGFVNRLAEDRDEMEKIVRSYAETFEKTAPTAMAMGRKCFTLLADLPASQALDAAQFLNLPFFFGEELQEGAESFLERRKPQWRPLKG